MQIKYLGHAGFCVETENSCIIMDPWLSPNGAFDAAWFQYPKNHHLAALVHDKLNTHKEKFIYISHEHKDHFDIEFLTSLKNRDFTMVLTAFLHPVVEETLQAIQYSCKNIIVLKDNESLPFEDGVMTAFVIDMELDADSALLVKSTTGSFLNLNDSKPHDRLSQIAQQYGPIDVLTCQFSGAIWHPTCYVMEQEAYQAVCQAKIKNKFDTIAAAIEIFKPTVYLPSAGPACFLDPLLLPIHFQPINTFPRAKQLFDYLNQHFSKAILHTQLPEIMPGDVLDVPGAVFTHLALNRVEDDQFHTYVQAYAKTYEAFFKARDEANARIDAQDVFTRLKPNLIEKLERMALVHHHVAIPLYFSLLEHPEAMYCIDFQRKRVSIKTKIEHENNFYSIKAPAWQVQKVLSGELSWADFALTFRVTLQRVPDIYNTLLHAFLTLDHDRLAHFCELFRDILSKNERITVQDGAKKYSILRYCPHQGGDLLYATITDGLLECPRHHWKFNLENGGACPQSCVTIDAICLKA
jgi:UDP-MurNAc hydroxylase